MMQVGKRDGRSKPLRLKKGVMYEFREVNLNGQPTTSGKRWRGSVKQEYPKFYLMEDTKGFTVCVHKHGNDTEWMVKRV